MPAWRGQRLRDLLAACGQCSVAGGAKDHYWPKPAGCQACAEQPARKVRVWYGMGCCAWLWGAFLKGWVCCSSCGGSGGL